MEATPVPTQSMALKYGLIIAGGLIAYFLLMKMLGFIHVSELRALNFLIILGGLFYTIRTYKDKTRQGVDYLEGFALGFYTASVAAVAFGAFVYLYLIVLDPGLFEQLKNDAPIMGKYFTPLSAAVTVLAEIMIAGLILSFALMQYYKNDRKHS